MENQAKLAVTSRRERYDYEAASPAFPSYYDYDNTSTIEPHFDVIEPVQNADTNIEIIIEPKIVHPTPIYPDSIVNNHAETYVNYPAVEEQKQEKLWSNIDTYLHIFLTFFFGHLASMLFFDGIIRSAGNAFLLSNPLMQIVNIIFSIAYLGFSVWFLTVSWRWWRSKALVTNPYIHNGEQIVGVEISKNQKTIAQIYLTLSTFVLLIGLTIYLVLGIIDCYARKNHQHVYDSTASHIDAVVFAIRVFVWCSAIVALLLLNRDYFLKKFCTQSNAAKERPKSGN